MWDVKYHFVGNFYYQKSDMQFNQILESNLKLLLQKIKPFVREILTPFKLEKSRLIDAMEFRIEGAEMVMYAPEYIEFADKGRGAGKMPPVGKILDWVLYYKLANDMKSANKMVWAVAKSISKRGTQGKFFLKRLTEEIFDIYMETIDDSFEQYFKNL